MRPAADYVAANLRGALRESPCGGCSPRGSVAPARPAHSDRDRARARPGPRRDHLARPERSCTPVASARLAEAAAAWAADGEALVAAPSGEPRERRPGDRGRRPAAFGVRGRARPPSVRNVELGVVAQPPCPTGLSSPCAGTASVRRPRRACSCVLGRSDVQVMPVGPKRVGARVTGGRGGHRVTASDEFFFCLGLRVNIAQFKLARQGQRPRRRDARARISPSCPCWPPRSLGSPATPRP